MPRISQDFLDTTFYLYANRDAAEKGDSSGGTGFLVTYAPFYSSGDHQPHVYAVANRHVAVTGGCPVVRVNKLDGTTQIFEFDVSDWDFIPHGNDIAVKRIPLQRDLHQFCCLALNHFITREILELRGIGPGEDVFMIGRFVDHDGGATNKPAVRFGNVSVMPAPIWLEDFDKSGAHECYCIDMRSRPGFSGSPVFLYRVFGQDIHGHEMRALLDAVANPLSPTALPRHGTAFPNHSTYLGLLGIHCAQFGENFPVKAKTKTGLRRTKRQAYIAGMSGMTIVAPAWDIKATLDIPKLQKERDEIDAARSMASQH